MQNQEPIYLIVHATRIHSTPPGQLLVVRSERRQTEARDLVALGDDWAKLSASLDAKTCRTRQACFAPTP